VNAQQRLLLAGVSTRAAAESAARAGFDVVALDAYADLDQHPAVRALSITRDYGSPYSPFRIARASRFLDVDAVVYTSGFENHPRSVAALAKGRALWGNAPAVLRRVRDPFAIAKTLGDRGFAVPATRDRRTAPEPAPGQQWLIKPRRSGGGHRVRRWTVGDAIGRGEYLQQLIDGAPASLVFVAAGGRVVPLGFSRQLVGEAAFGADGYRYCGSILVGAGDPLGGVEQCAAMAGVIANECGLVGVNGIDVVVRDGIPYPIEVNPRWSASMELVERAYGVSVFGAHAAACRDGRLPDFDLAAAMRHPLVAGKAIVFAKRTAAAGDTRPWLEDPDVADVPRPGDCLMAGRPVCTVFAAADDGTSCHDALVDGARRIHARVEEWQREPAS